MGVCSCTTSTSTYCPPGAWTPWSACSPDGYQIRWCSTHGADTQIQACPAPTPGGGGGGGSPTPPPITCVPSSWTEGSCDGGSCTASQRQLTRTVSPAGCTTTSTCIADSSCGTATDPIVPGCTKGAWINASCGTGTCAANQMRQTRTVSPAGCTFTSWCIADSACVDSNPPTPPPGCTPSGWTNTTCGAGTCDNDQMQQTRTVTPAGCASTRRCVANSSCVPTCTISLSPSTLNLLLGGPTGSITATASCNVPIDRVTFTPSDTSIVTVSPGTDSSSPYTTTVTAVGAGATNVTGSVYVVGTTSAIATDTTTVNSTPPEAWWQVIDADVTTGGDMTVDLPSGEDFNLDGAGGFPGIPSYEGSTNLTNSNVSSEGWLVRTTSTTPKVYDYEALSDQIPANIKSTFNTINAGDNVSSELRSGSASHDSDNYYWFMYDGAANGSQPLNLNATSLGGRKAILLVKDANLNITGNVTLDNGAGFFMVVVDGNINVSTSVGGGSGPNLEGIYEADGAFNTGLDDTSLYIRGSVVAYGGVNLQRDLIAGNISTPAELFEYGPDQILLYPNKLGVRRIEWKEVAPN